MRFEVQTGFLSVTGFVIRAQSLVCVVSGLGV